MSMKSEKTREQILAERQEKKKKKAALKNQPKEKGQSNTKDFPADNKLSNAKENGKNNSVKDSTEVNTKNEKTELSVSNISDTKKLICNKSNESKSQFEEKTIDKNFKESKKEDSESFQKNLKEDVVKNSGDKSESNKIGVDESLNKKDEIKSKAQLKAERRAKQEAERARKLQKTLASTPEKKVEQTSNSTHVVKSIKTFPQAAPEISHKVKLFAHLYHVQLSNDENDAAKGVHPSILQLQTQFSTRVVSGANASCLALLNALKKVVMNYETPSNQEFSRGLESEVTKCMTYLSKHRPVAVSMANAVRHLKFKINQSKGYELECKNSISNWIDTYIKEQLDTAAEAICQFVREKITTGDVILTYGWSSLIHRILISAHNEKIKFQVIVADGRPWLEGRELLKKLVKAGIQCTYVFVNGLSYIMPEVTKILLGAHALFANGYVMSRVGTSQIALLAKKYNVPVLVCCETHKFSERVQTDSFVHNELGNPDDLASNKGCISKALSKWKTIQSLTPLNLLYDVTPPDLVSAVVTEIAVLPCTSVPVILRIKPADL